MIKKLSFFTLALFSLFINAQQSYYDNVDLTKTGTELKEALATKIINTHTTFLSYTPGIWEACKATDLDPNNSANVLLIYGYDDTDNNSLTDRSRDKDANGGNNGTDWNREHTFPRSLGNPNLGSVGPGSDAHHLRPSDVDFNADRSNLPFVAGSGNAGVTNNGWYPGDEWKGDVARMMMYMYLRYDEQCLPSTVGIGDNSSTPDEMIDLFLTWNAEDPVSQIEDNRNTFHENTTNQYAQGNRNPFIDNPNLATQIWGGIVAQNRWDATVSDDTENPSIPLNLVISDVTSNTLTFSWDSATDNVGVIAYQVFVNEVAYATTGGTSIIIEDLEGSTNYTMYVVARDAAGNTSENSASTVATTLEEVIDTTEYCVSESFDNVGASSSSYTEVSWTGDNGSQWNATDARTDQTLSDGSKAITIRVGELTTTAVTGGISSFSVKTQRVFGGGSGTFDLNVNGLKVGEIPFTDEEETIIISDINIIGVVEISITNNTPVDDRNRVVFDDLKWECYDDGTTPEDDLESPTTPLNLTTSAITTDEITLSWDSATDNVGVTSYEIFVDNVSYTTTNTTSTILENLEANTTYSIYVVAKDFAGNTSENSAATIATTLEEVIDTTEYCITESFDNIGESVSSYTEISWIGDNGLEWNATDARTDQTLSDGSKAITIRAGELTTTSVSGGIRSFSVKTQRIFGGGSGTFDLNVNGEKVGEIPFSDEEDTIKIEDIDIAGDVEISITNNSPNGDGNRVVFDDLQWECYEPIASVDDINLFSNIKTYPNPSDTGYMTIQLNSNIEVNNLKVYTIIGEEIMNLNNPDFVNNEFTLKNLESGMYLMTLSNNKETTTTKLIVK